MEKDVTLTVKVYGIETQEDLDEAINAINEIAYVSDVQVKDKATDGIGAEDGDFDGTLLLADDVCGATLYTGGDDPLSVAVRREMGQHLGRLTCSLPPHTEGDHAAHRNHDLTKAAWAHWPYGRDDGVGVTQTYPPLIHKED